MKYLTGRIKKTYRWQAGEQRKERAPATPGHRASHVCTAVSDPRAEHSGPKMSFTEIQTHHMRYWMLKTMYVGQDIAKQK